MVWNYRFFADDGNPVSLLMIPIIAYIVIVFIVSFTGKILLNKSIYLLKINGLFKSNFDFSGFHSLTRKTRLFLNLLILCLLILNIILIIYFYMIAILMLNDWIKDKEETISTVSFSSIIILLSLIFILMMWIINRKYLKTNLVVKNDLENKVKIETYLFKNQQDFLSTNISDYFNNSAISYPLNRRYLKKYNDYLKNNFSNDIEEQFKIANILFLAIFSNIIFLKWK
ncbi:hypothetical protein [Mycoplasmopsis agassizii]|nr:hypothetical protein [Mycoplasmopsis agassizii]SMC19423.1 hypothetical protein SAMN02745179_00902 [Mycoplasmopsis agassizii]